MTVSLIKEVEVGEVLETPATPHTERMQNLIAEESMIEHSVGLGYAISYRQEQQGRLIQNIVPVHKNEFQQISTSSKVTLALHTETAFHPYKPDYVMLLCLRGDLTAITTYAEAQDILSELDEKNIDILRQERFTTGIDISFRSEGEGDKRIPITILKEHDGDFSFTYDADLMVGTDVEAKRALLEIEKAIEKCTKEIILLKRDLLIIDNNKTVHGRKPFQPKYNGFDRWVKRMLVRKTMPPSTVMNGHVVEYQF